MSSRTAAWVRRGIDEAERREARRRRLRAEAALGRGEGLEQGSEVDPLVDGPDRELVLAQLALELLGRRTVDDVAVAEHPGEMVEGRGLGRERVDLLLVDELEVVLDAAQVAVRGGEARGVVGVDVAGVGHLGERGQGGR